MNPYRTTVQTILGESPITDEIVEQLIEGTDTETIAVYDVSDCLIYGRKHYRQLTGAHACAADAEGCFPEVYQTVYWLCLVFMPVWPLGVYFVIPCKECDDPDGDAMQYRGVRAPWDSLQVISHYVALVLLMFGAALAIWYWIGMQD